MINLTELCKYLDAWWVEREDRIELDLSDAETDILLQAGCIVHDGHAWRILHREIILPECARNVARFHQMRTALAATMQGNRDAPIRLERRMTNHIREDKVQEFRRRAKEAGSILFDLDDWCVQHYDPDGVEVQVIMFQYDAA